ncbi:MAG TPA: NnrS family protein [Terriglobales bacterium]|nr:NnrS family protein [Terriglobales bacterium]
MADSRLPVLGDTAGDTAAYERSLSRLLMAFLASGLVFLLGPGSFLGLWNLLGISQRHASLAVSPAWLQAHGHAEVFGWVGSFILGIGFHSLTRQSGSRVAMGWAWACWALWSAGVALRWLAGVTAWRWRWTLPLAAAMELAAYWIFRSSLRRAHEKDSSEARARMPGWILLVLTGAFGFLLVLAFNLVAAVVAAVQGTGPALPAAWDARLISLMTWAFLVPFVLGFSTRWLPIFAGFRAAPERAPRALAVVILAGAAATLAGLGVVAAILWLLLALAAGVCLGPYRRAVQPAKTKGIHASFPVFVRTAYGWLAIAAGLELWASLAPAATGAGGAGRHALTVGFIAGMVLTIGPRVLPAFSGMRALYSPRLMLAALLALQAGCALRVLGEVLAYPGWLPRAWEWLPISAGLEVAAFTLFAYNLARTLLRPPEHLRRRNFA